ncbi:C-type lectin domain family 4 member E-like [Acanthopagrus latus]|uniref:C-type lectin domain family 4 member E-like n=1 Tax=Acanthopagrus latus TaxID=8177 RepID=UPI00187BED2D|nr:C-type lectin domain family 4 member E-like [Acanthopagrus latus]
MVRVQPQRIRCILGDDVMDAQYQQFSSSDNDSVQGGHRMSTQPAGMKRVVAYILYTVLVVLLLILLMVTGVKFSQLNKEISDIKGHLARMSHKGAGSSSTAGAAPVEEVPLQKITPVRGACREGWVSFQGSCYLLSVAAVTWSQAEEKCRTHGGHLVVLNSVEELDYISKIVEIQHSYWIGLVEREHEGHWSWVDGTDFNSTPTYWDEGQPDNWDYRQNGEDCGQIHGSERRKRKMWNDADCHLTYRFICEIRS